MQENFNVAENGEEKNRLTALRLRPRENPGPARRRIQKS